MLTMAMLHDAQRVLSGVINRTPVIPSTGITDECRLFLKADCLQKTGAFKLRGAYYKIATLSDEEKAGRHRLLRRKPRTGRGFRRP